MSRIGNTPISLPTDVTLTVVGSEGTVKGPKGTLTIPLQRGLKIEQAEGVVKVVRASDSRQIKAWHGLVRSMLQNAVEGVSKGYQKRMKIIGTGYRVQTKGSGLTLAVGLSHTVDVNPLPGVVLKTEGTDTIVIDGIDKQAVGQMAANLRAIRPPEVYKGKGIRYEGEYIKLKAGKTAASTS